MKFLAAILFLSIASQLDAKVFSKCDFAWTMRNAGFSTDSLPDWVCTVQHESNFNTNAINKINTDGSWDWGLFQINDRYWCKPGWNGNECNMNCYNLLNDDTGDDINCVKKIFGVHGHSAWTAWTNYCSNGRSQAWQYQVKECGL